MNVKRILSGVIAATMVVAAQLPAFAATTDPNMTSYNTDFTISAAAGSSHILRAVPADNYWTATSFSTEEDAADVVWTVVDGSTAGVSIDPDSIDGVTENGTIYSQATVAVAANVTPGVASIKATNPDTNASVNFTIRINTAVTGSKNNVTYKFYDGNSTTALLTKTNMSVFDTNAGTSLYPSALDGVQQLDDSGDLTADIADSYLSDITINGQEYNAYTDASWNYFGWQYRVYRNNQVVPLSEYVGVDDFPLQNGDVVVMRYGQYGVVTFADTL